MMQTMTNAGNPAAEIILRTEGVGKVFGKFVALNNISAEFPRGAITSIIGPNGAGKSTYFNLLSGAFPPSSGRVEFEGRDVTGLPQHRFAHMGVAKSFQIRPTNCWRWSAWANRASGPPRRSRMASSGRSKSGWRWPAGRGSCCWMSRPRE
jgi:ABC-type uncharacterized transport system ATPase subunit